MVHLSLTALLTICTITSAQGLQALTLADSASRSSGVGVEARAGSSATGRVLHEEPVRAGNGLGRSEDLHQGLDSLSSSRVLLQGPDLGVETTAAAVQLISEGAPDVVLVPSRRCVHSYMARKRRLLLSVDCDRGLVVHLLRAKFAPSHAATDLSLTMHRLGGC
jgi:hypothetical protein